MKAKFHVQNGVKKRRFKKDAEQSEKTGKKKEGNTVQRHNT